MVDLNDVPATTLTCPKCQVTSHFTPESLIYSKEQAWVVQECDNCDGYALTIFDIEWRRMPSRTYAEYSNGPKEVYPFYNPTPDSSIPNEIADDYSEAVRCCSSGSYNASAVMCRRAIETAAISLGANSNDRLVDQIKFLASKGLEQSLVDLSTEIRLFGNSGAHPDKHNLLRNVTRDEALALIQFLETFLDALYVRPAKIAALRKKRSKSP